MPSWDPAAFDPHDPGYLKNPYPTYARFREQAPVSLVQPYGRYWVFRYADVIEVLTNKTLFIKKAPTTGPPAPLMHALDNMPRGLFSLDPPKHDVRRAAVEPFFMNAIAGARATAQQQAVPLLQQMTTSRRVELISAYAAPLPSTVLFSVLGVPQEDWPYLPGWVTSIVAGHDITQKMAVQVGAGVCDMALNSYYQGFIRGCQKSAQPGLVNALIAHHDDDHLPKDFVQILAADLTIAGYASTTFLIGTGMLNLLNNPAQLRLLRQDPAQWIAPAVEEMLRYDAPAQIVDRYVAADTTLPSGATLKQGSAISAILGSANRDPEAFDDPDTFDFTKTRTNPHLGFGDGIHFCIGAPLARQVTPVAIQALLAAIPNITLAGTPQWQTDPYLRAVVNLPLEIA